MHSTTNRNGFGALGNVWKNGRGGAGLGSCG